MSRTDLAVASSVSRRNVCGESLQSDVFGGQKVSRKVTAAAHTSAANDVEVQKGTAVHVREAEQELLEEWEKCLAAGRPGDSVGFEPVRGGTQTLRGCLQQQGRPTEGAGENREGSNDVWVLADGCENGELVCNLLSGRSDLSHALWPSAFRDFQHERLVLKA